MYIMIDINFTNFGSFVDSEVSYYVSQHKIIRNIIIEASVTHDLNNECKEQISRPGYGIEKIVITFNNDRL